MSNIGDSITTAVKLAPGQVCQYELKAKCGLPKISWSSLITDNIEIKFVGYNDDDSDDNSWRTFLGDYDFDWADSFFSDFFKKY